MAQAVVSSSLPAFPAKLTTAEGIEGSSFLSTFENIRHLADLCERGAVGPGVNHIHQVRLELVQVRLLVHVQLGVCRDFGDALRTLLKTGGRSFGSQTSLRTTTRLCLHTVSPAFASKVQPVVLSVLASRWPGGGGKNIKMTCARSS